MKLETSEVTEDKRIVIAQEPLFITVIEQPSVNNAALCAKQKPNKKTLV